jgi:hypothetical protein
VFWALFHPLSPLFSGIRKRKGHFINAQGSRLIIIIVHVRAVKIYVAAVEVVAQEKGKTG